MFDDQIEDSGQQDSTEISGLTNQPYEVADEEMSELNRGGPATDDQMAEISDPADPTPDDQDVRRIDGATEQIADIDTEEWEDRVAVEERNRESNI